MSDYFQRELASRSDTPVPGVFEEVITTLNIEDCIPTIFESFHDWLLGRRLPARLRSSGHEAFLDHHQNELFELYVFAHRFDVPQLRRDSLDAYIKLCVEGSILPPPKHIAAAYESMLPEVPMIDFMLDAYASMWDGMEKFEVLDEYRAWMSLPAHFFRKLARRRFSQLHLHDTEAQGCRFDLCNYHEHLGAS